MTTLAVEIQLVNDSPDYRDVDVFLPYEDGSEWRVRVFITKDNGDVTICQPMFAADGESEFDEPSLKRVPVSLHNRLNVVMPQVLALLTSAGKVH